MEGVTGMGKEEYADSIADYMMLVIDDKMIKECDIGYAHSFFDRLDTELPMDLRNKIREALI